MGKKGMKDKYDEIVDCGACDSFISIASSIKRGDVVYCEDCDAEYLIKSRKPLRLEMLDDEDVYNTQSGYDDDNYSIGDYGFGDDDYNDGRYD